MPWRQPEIYWTDGCAYLAEQALSYWLLDAIASHQLELRVRQEPFQMWTLEVRANRTGSEPVAMLRCRTDTEPEGTLLVEQPIPYTDFTLETMRLYVVHGSIDGTQQISIGMLPGEY